MFLNQLDMRMTYFLQYLDQLFRKDPHLGKDYHDLQVKLYAEYDRPRLIQFLRSSNYLSLQKAMEECQRRSLYPEMVFLLGRHIYCTYFMGIIPQNMSMYDAAQLACERLFMIQFHLAYGTQQLAEVTLLSCMRDELVLAYATH
jgi:Region in Clathrin and VPS